MATLRPRRVIHTDSPFAARVTSSLRRRRASVKLIEIIIHPVWHAKSVSEIEAFGKPEFGKLKIKNQKLKRKKCLENRSYIDEVIAPTQPSPCVQGEDKRGLFKGLNWQNANQ